MEVKYNLVQITKALEKLFSAGFNTDKKILAMKLEDLVKIGNLSSVEIVIIIDFRMAVKNRSLIAFLSGYNEKGENKMKTYEFNVKLYGKISLEVVATSKKEAKQMVQDLIDGITVKDIELRESSNRDITIKDGTVLKEINSKNRDMER